MAPRASWKGTITFGLVSIPVGLTGAVTELDLAFKEFVKVAVKVPALPPLPEMLVEELHSVGRQEIDKTHKEATGQVVVVDREDILKGYKVEDQVIPLTPAEMEALAPKASRAIEITSFVPVRDIDPIFYQKHCYAFPTAGGEKPYAVLVAALRSSGMVGIGTLVQRAKQHLIAVRAVNGALVVSYLNYADEVKSVATLELKEIEVSAQEWALAESLISAMAGEWRPEDYEDSQRNRVLELIMSKAAGVEPVKPEPQPEVASVTQSLLDALAASIAKFQRKDK